MRHPTKEVFLQDVKDHRMVVRLDSDLYRHLEFKAPWGWFDLVTYPGGLLIRGDMGSYLFERIPDMFQFFGGREDLSINLSYWAQKCVAEGRERIKCFDLDSVTNQIREALKDYAEAYEGFDPEEALASLNLYDVVSIEGAYRALRDYDDLHDTRIFDEIGLSETYTYHYVWCCYAIVWGIAQYHTLKLSP